MKFGEVIGNMLGGGANGLLGKGLDLINKRVKDKDLAEKLSHDFKVLAADNAHEVEMLAMEMEQDFERQVTERAKADAASNDTYTQRTRPMIARQSWWAGLGYIGTNVTTTVASSFAANVVIVPLDWSILTAIFSPALTYMGVRTFDKWKRGGK